uniref:Mitochondrial ribosomal protein L27 n=1 Tax=Papio anubis TaxID=9555 RepID=A0A8I5NGZ6_PAPAN
MASVVLALRTRTAVTSLLSSTPATTLAVRYASKKTGGSSRNLGGKSSGKRLGIKKMEGHYVHAGNIIGTQLHFRWHPGAHKHGGCGSDHQAAQGCCTLQDFCPRGSCQAGGHLQTGSYALMSCLRPSDRDWSPGDRRW